MDTQRLFRATGTREFESLALGIFRYQYKTNPVYREFCGYLGKEVHQINSLADIPFLPIEFFKTRRVVCGQSEAVLTFTSSGTTASQPSRHFVTDPKLYEKSYLLAFEHFYGPVTDYCILALLPSYLEREGSSLIYMVSDLIRRSRKRESGFYLDDLETLRNTLQKLQREGQRTLLIGVSFALLDFVEKYSMELDHTIVMETGGMKGRRKELVREALHDRLKTGFGQEVIHSEYGMTELLSQAYSAGNGLFQTPPWMQVCIRDPEDPFSLQATGRTGGVNIIDLANVHSCSFLATQDLGRMHPDGRFEILGRFDHSDIRGCNLMAL